MPLRNGYETLKASEIEFEVADRLPDGFVVLHSRFRGKYFLTEFTYCGRHKYIMMQVDPQQTLGEIVELITDQIELIPAMEYPASETIPPIYRAMQTWAGAMDGR